MKTRRQELEILGRDGETKIDMLDWFKRRGFFASSDDRVFTVLLAGAVTHYGMEQHRLGVERAKQEPRT
jgi:hypothetical protein